MLLAYKLVLTKVLCLCYYIKLLGSIVFGEIRGQQLVNIVQKSVLQGQRL